MDNKMLFKKLILLLFIGLFVALFLYPMLHEAGHIAAALLFGGTIEEVTWFPRYSVLCNTAALTEEEQAVIGLAGGIIPSSYLFCLRLQSILFGMHLLC